MKGETVISYGIQCSKEEKWWIWETKREVEDNTYNRVVMNKDGNALQRKEINKHKEEDDDVPEEMNEEIPEDILNKHV